MSALDEKIKWMKRSGCALSVISESATDF